MAEFISYLIIGNGIAGATAAEILRTEDSAATIAVVADDPFPVYYRPALKDYLAGRIHEDKLWARPNSFYQDHTIHFLPDRVTAIDVAQHAVRLQSGRQLAYKHLLLANGAVAHTLRCPGADLRGVTTLRTVSDYQQLMQDLNGAQRVVVVGGGTLALETIETLQHRGYQVSHLVRNRILWSEVLDETASDLVLQQERRAGIDVRLETEVAEIKGNKQGQVTALITTSGELISCDVVVTAIGIEPNIDFIKASGISCGRGVQVDALMRTNAPDIYAAGDVLETTDALTRRTRVIGQWYPAIQQARAAAYSMLGLLDEQARFDASLFYNATFLYGLDFAAVGVTNRQGYQELAAEPQPRSYRKLLLKDNVPVGMLALGDRKQTLAFKRAIDHHVNLSPVLSRIFASNFQLGTWLDQQDIPPALLGAQRAAPKAAQQPVAKQLTQTALQEPPPTEMVLVHAPDRVSGLHLQELILKQQSSLLIGRLPGIPLLIDQGSVSRRHAELSYAAGQYLLRDLGSTNGTFVNEQRLEPQRPQALKPNDTVRFGRYVTFRFIVRPLKRATASAKTHVSMAGVTRLQNWDDGKIALPSAQPVLNPDGSLQLPGAAYPVPSSVIASAHETPVLIVLSGKEGQRLPQTVLLHAGKRLLVGREQGADIALADVEVSRRHAEFFPGPDGFYVRDLGSSNGVIVNQTRIANPYLLKHSDRIVIGDCLLYFLDLRSPESARQSLLAPAQAAPGAEVIKTDYLPTVSSSMKVVAPVAHVLICQQCGGVNTSTARFCAGCSTPLGSGARIGKGE